MILGTSAPSGVDGARGRQILGYVCLAAAVWLGWEIVKIPVADRADVSVAVRLSSTSPDVLRRTAEVEFAAERYENARVLSEASLARAPFNARALRVRGLTEARGSDLQRADDLLTLAGNWSLRDDPAHAWLMENRLRRGDYASSFAHADTLARRRADLHPQVFNLFTSAALADQRSLPHLTRLLAAFPPWRPAYLNSLHAREDGDPVLAALAIALEKTAKPFTDSELGHLYRTWASERRYPGIRFLRTQLKRPPMSEALQNGDFSVDASPDVLPFGWRLGTAAGISVQITADDVRRDDNALRVDYDGRRDGVFVEQLMILDPGAHVLSGQQRIEASAEEPRMRWTVSCAESGVVFGEGDVDASRRVGGTWRNFNIPLRVPTANCAAQWLRLTAVPGDRRSQVVAWFDGLNVGAAAGAGDAPEPNKDAKTNP